MDDERDAPRPVSTGRVGPTRVGAGRRPHPGPGASRWALEIWRASEEVADLLDQFNDAEERRRAAELVYRDADGRVRTRHGLLRGVPRPGEA